MHVWYVNKIVPGVPLATGPLRSRDDQGFLIMGHATWQWDHIMGDDGDEHFPDL